MRILHQILLGLCFLLSPQFLSAAEPPATVTKVALFKDSGVSLRVGTLIAAVQKSERFELQNVTAEEIRAGKLSEFAAVILPGGSSSSQSKALEAEGREKIKQFVKEGGGYVGVCAGAYLATCDYAWSLHILNAKVIDKQHWARGIADLEVSLPATGKEFFARESDRLTLHYHQGPLLAPAENKDLPAYQELARFETEVAKNGAPEGVMIGTSAIVSAEFGKGRVLCFSPHPELTKDMEGLLHRGLLWTARAKP